jgi:hypothetical protein
MLRLGTGRKPELDSKAGRFVMSDRVTFGVFEFDPASGTLWRKGRVVRFQRQPARIRFAAR